MLFPFFEDWPHPIGFRIRVVSAGLGLTSNNSLKKGTSAEYSSFSRCGCDNQLFLLFVEIWFPDRGLGGKVKRNGARGGETHDAKKVRSRKQRSSRGKNYC